MVLGPGSIAIGPAGEVVARGRPKKDSPLSTLGKLIHDQSQLPKDAPTQPLYAQAIQKQIRNTPNKVVLTRKALLGDPDAIATLKKMEDDAVRQSGRSAREQVQAKLSIIDADSTARAIVEGRTVFESVKNTFGVPVAEHVRQKVLALDPTFNFNQPRATEKGVTASLTQQYKNRGMMGSFVTNINKQIGRMEEIGKDLTRFNVRALDKPVRQLVRSFKGSGKENVVQAYVKEIGAEIAKLSQGSAASIQQLPEDNRKEWENIHDPNLSMRELMVVLRETTEMANMRLSSVDQEIESTLKLLENIRINPRSEFDAGGPKVGTVDGGYKFTGGDPADSSNWEKVTQ
jgi:hypothetical protein